MTPAEQIRAFLDALGGAPVDLDGLPTLVGALAALDALEAELIDLTAERDHWAYGQGGASAADRVWLTRDEAMTHRSDLIDDGGYWKSFIALLDERIGGQAVTGAFYDRDGKKLAEIEIPDTAAYLAVAIADDVFYTPVAHAPQVTSIRSMIERENPPLKKGAL